MPRAPLSLCLPANRPASYQRLERRRSQSTLRRVHCAAPAGGNRERGRAGASTRNALWWLDYRGALGYGNTAPPVPPIVLVGCCGPRARCRVFEPRGHRPFTCPTARIRDGSRRARLNDAASVRRSSRSRGGARASRGARTAHWLYDPHWPTGRRRPLPLPAVLASGAAGASGRGPRRRTVSSLAARARRTAS